MAEKKMHEIWKEKAEALATMAVNQRTALGFFDAKLVEKSAICSEAANRVLAYELERNNG